MPINGSQFAYVELVETLRKVAQTQANVTLPGNFTFTDLRSERMRETASSVLLFLCILAISIPLNIRMRTLKESFLS